MTGNDGMRCGKIVAWDEGWDGQGVGMRWRMRWEEEELACLRGLCPLSRNFEVLTLKESWLFQVAGSSQDQSMIN